MRDREMNSISCSPWLRVSTKQHFMLIWKTREHRTDFLIHSISPFPSYFLCHFSFDFLVDVCSFALILAVFLCVVSHYNYFLKEKKKEIGILTGSVTVVPPIHVLTIARLVLYHFLQILSDFSHSKSNIQRATSIAFPL